MLINSKNQQLKKGRKKKNSQLPSGGKPSGKSFSTSTPIKEKY